MNKEKFNELGVEAGFYMVKCMDNKSRLGSPNDRDVIDGELEVFKDLLLNEVIKELNALSGEIDLGLSTDVFVQIALKAAIEKIEAMK
jgi:hypothetical protein